MRTIECQTICVEDLSRQRSLVHRQDDGQDPVVVGGRHLIGIDVIPEGDLPPVAAGEAFTGQPLHLLLVQGRAVSGQGQDAATHVDVDAPGVHARKVRVDEVAILHAVDVDRHELGRT